MRYGLLVTHSASPTISRGGYQRSSLDGVSPADKAELAVISESIEIKVLVVDFLIFSVGPDFLDRFVEL